MGGIIVLNLIIASFVICPLIYLIAPDSATGKIIHMLLLVVSVTIILASFFPFDATLLIVGVILLSVYVIQNIRLHHIDKKELYNHLLLLPK